MIVQLSEADRLQAKVDQWHAEARACWEAHNILSSAEKSVSQSYSAKELGCDIDGKEGILGATVQRRWMR